jgi:FMN phosphatase YigB (HAD superfamily)|tara:strand:+ start:7311 stop:7946 length:636 start_codon:yes stop_codon:yes gene_type:complete
VKATTLTKEYQLAYTKKNKIILTDCDGVCLDWEEGFSVWMEHHGHEKVDGYQFVYSIGKRYGISNNQAHKLIRQFNESAAIGFLPPLRDAQYFIRKLSEQHGYKFIAVTSLSTDPYAKELRERNLAKLFGDAFIECICLPTGADKDDILASLAIKYKGNYWIEDKPENVTAGTTVGLRGILVEHGHNMTAKIDGFVAKTWENIYDHIVNNG